MINISFKIDNNELAQIKSFFSKYEVEATQFTICVFKYKNCKISVFQSNQVLIQGKNQQDVYDELVNKHIIKSKNILDHKEQSISLINQNDVDIVGCDEVGVGDFFGGIVVAACWVKKQNVNELLSIGVKDSKLLSDKQIKDIFCKIIKKVIYAVKYVNPSEYNNLYQKFKNAHIIKTYLHNQALIELTTKLKTNDSYKIVMDEYCSKNNYDNYIKTIGTNEVVDIDIFKTHAESEYVAVACASIIARVYFLNQIDILNKSLVKYNLSLLLGNNNNVQNLAKQIYEKNHKLLDNLVKKHFITYNKIVGDKHEQ